jgi:hypothetical protein
VTPFRDLGSSLVLALSVMTVATGLAAYAGNFSQMTLEKCETAYDPRFYHGGTDQYEDLGNSTVMYRDFFSPGFTSEASVVVVHCRSGQTLYVLAQRQDSETNLDQYDATAASMRDIARSSESFSFDDMAKLFAGRGLEVSLKVSDKEICLCNALYPRDRGTKAPFVFKTQWVEEPPPDKRGD